ncbi:MAG: hypothetical protein QNJ53_16085 [Pleurocapsa sp. MO_192.B19]|nr:hypothetical protein [Pleurocapsa sp. MO_192.B19]
MFEKSPREPQKPQTSDLQDIELSSPANANFISPQDTQDTLIQPQVKIAEENKNELTLTVEKISRIVSPYFVVVVGLALYKNNFLIGTILIVVGIFSLLKISTKDIGNFLDWLKSFLGFGDPTEP